MAVRIEMDMPKKCGKCRLRVLETCAAENDLYFAPIKKTHITRNKPSWCPLKECE